MQKCAHLVGLQKCCQTHIFLQNFVLVQPRTSLPKICKIILIANFANLIPGNGNRSTGGTADLNIHMQIDRAVRAASTVRTGLNYSFGTKKYCHQIRKFHGISQFKNVLQFFCNSQRILTYSHTHL